MGDLVRVNIRILDSRTGSQLWAKVFDRDLNNIFAVQSEIADSVVIQLVEHGIVPSGQERVVAAAPTENQEALLAYQTGRTQGVIAAAETHARAVALDPGFAWAWAALSAAHVDHLWYNFDRSEGRRDSARNALEQARALAPDDPLVLLAEAYYLDKIERSYAQALELYARVAEARPNDPMVEVYWSSCYRRAGRWTEAAVHRLRAIELNPTQAGNYMELALTYMGLRQYDKANEYFDLSFERGGTNFWIKAANYWLVGQLDSARAMVVEEDRQLGPPEVGGRNGSPITWFWQEYFQREFEDAIHRLEAWDHQLVQDAGYHGPKRLYIGFAYQALGQLEAARAQYDSARVVLEAWLDVPEERNAARTHSDLGIVYALLGRPQEAIEAGERAVEMHVNEHFWGPREIGKLAFIHTILGDYDAALELIEGLLSTDAGHVMSVPLLELDPRWDPLHGHPRYTEIIEEYGG
jgi:tetratricopeptide (TPR) repeat protein